MDTIAEIELLYRIVFTRCLVPNAEKFKSKEVIDLAVRLAKAYLEVEKVETEIKNLYHSYYK